MKAAFTVLLVLAVAVTAFSPNALPAATPAPVLRPLPVPADPKLPSLFLIGASDVRNGRGDGRDGLWGWGEPLGKFFDPLKINVVNRAVGGRSARTYQTQGYWDATRALMKAGDYLIIAFGPYDPRMINDATRPHGMLAGVGEETTEIENVVTKQHEVVHTFGWYIRKFIAEAKELGVTPILCSNTALKIWQDGRIARVMAPTGDRWAAQIARAANLHYLPLNEITAHRYEILGTAKVEALFGRGDVVHTNAAGADLNAQCLIAGLKAWKESPLGPFYSNRAREIDATSVVSQGDPTASPK